MKRTQQGIALITALLVLAIVVVLAAHLAQESALSLRRTENLLHQGQGQAYLQGAEDWARQILARDDRGIDHLGEPWATPLPPIPVEGGEIQGRLVDLQGRLNLNALLAKDGQPEPLMRQRLICVLHKAGIEQAEAALDALADWQDADSEVRPLGAEDGVYQALPRPYRAGNQPLLSRLELILIQGFDPAAVDRLQALVAALPANTDVNLNTAPLEVLSCLGEGVDEAAWRAFIEERRRTPLKKVEDLLGKEPFQGRINPKGIGTASRFFLLEAEAHVGRTVTRRYSVLQRDDQGSVRVLRRFQETP